MEEVTLKQIKNQLDFVTQMLLELKESQEDDYLTHEEMILVDEGREEWKNGLLVTQEEIDEERLRNGLEI